MMRAQKIDLLFLTLQMIDQAQRQGVELLTSDDLKNVGEESILGRGTYGEGISHVTLSSSPKTHNRSTFALLVFSVLRRAQQSRTCLETLFRSKAGATSSCQRTVVLPVSSIIFPSPFNIIHSSQKKKTGNWQDQNMYRNWLVFTSVHRQVKSKG